MRILSSEEKRKHQRAASRKYQLLCPYYNYKKEMDGRWKKH